MNLFVREDLTKMRIADLHRQADRERMAKAARRIGKKHSKHAALGHLTAVFTHQALALLAARSAQQAPDGEPVGQRGEADPQISSSAGVM